MSILHLSKFLLSSTSPGHTKTSPFLQDFLMK